jgi:hypothetical protein
VANGSSRFQDQTREDFDETCVLVDKNNFIHVQITILASYNGLPIFDLDVKIASLD